MKVKEMKATETSQWDVLVIGGGPAGMLAAAAARSMGAKVALLEKTGSLGRKMSITGGGRCNLTNTASLQEFAANIPGNGKFLFSALSRFSNRDCIRFFNGLGIGTKVEEQGRVFPVSEQASDVVAALEEHLVKSGVNLILQTAVKELLLSGSRCRGAAAADGGLFHSKTTVLATGGASYPRTGSTGDGYRLARRAGHRVTRPLPGLAPLMCAERQTARRLQGLSVKDTVITLLDEQGKKTASQQGDVIFTHFGLSGPAALKLSREVSIRREAGTAMLRLLVDTAPDTGEADLAGRLISMAALQPKKTAPNLLKQIFPGRLADVIVQRLELTAERTAGQTGKETWRGIAGLAKNFPLTVTGTGPLNSAMITVGGISTGEINPGTMASRLVDGLFFAGEVIDVDAYTGGFNMQIAFSTGWTAGLSAAGEAGSATYFR